MLGLSSPPKNNNVIMPKTLEFPKFSDLNMKEIKLVKVGRKVRVYFTRHNVNYNYSLGSSKITEKCGVVFMWPQNVPIGEITLYITITLDISKTYSVMLSDSKDNEISRWKKKCTYCDNVLTCELLV